LETSRKETVPECLTCRIVGGTVLTGTGFYMLHNARKVGLANGPRTGLGRRAVIGFGAVLVAAGFARMSGVQHTDVVRMSESLSRHFFGSTEKR